ncbi:pyridoxal phosphate-dependent aminotransferase [Ruminiclostridium cellulolyticum]|uniref:Aminotransferase class I and II n=1 Tax=Ruminiclostridium cellulolyticum (strain ATCC 35319 / DSM 5812 / JCM 6584 / H10) TaxID=394503 RepID=B8I0R8_RUMCH|nr:histidinol-phosphate transaminase [Ruminiclostridium cellulolyticum]ACL75643.1 aminotransferase class I and II [Ruminiclostridium cellulolyticum H10]
MRKLIHGGDIYSKRNLPNNTKLIDFSANINPLGLPEGVKKAILDSIDDFCNYPDPLCRELKKEISAYENVPEEYLFCGNGAADVIYRIASAIKPGKTLLTAPTFSEYEEAVKVFDSNITYHYLLREKNFNIDTDILDNITSDIRLMFLCNPNNPTGILTEKEMVLRIAEKCKATNTILVVDECFMEFLENPGDYSIVDSLDTYDNIIVLKAFTKIYAMAGLRLGYGICSDENIIEDLHRAGQPWNVSVAAQKCGMAALKEIDYVNRTRKLIKYNRIFLQNSLRKLGFEVINSKANYVLFRTEIKSLSFKLEKFGILIRSCDNYRGLDNKYFRIAVKSREDNEYLVNCIKKILLALH